MTATGRVRDWHDEEGWGVIDSPATPGGCWAHFSCVAVAGFRTLQPGQDVLFTFEAAQQDGYSYRADEAWPADQEPVRTDTVTGGPSTGYSSTLTVTFDDEDGSVR